VDLIGEHVGKMGWAMDVAGYEEVVTLHDEVVRMSAAVSAADVKTLIREADGMNKIARAHLDFRARPISFGGAVCFDNDPAHAVVIINGRSYAPGESVDQELVVRAITPAAITFEFRGIVVSQPMKSSAPNTAVAPPKAGGQPAERRRKKT
jgi:hypothetical protein